MSDALSAALDVFADAIADRVVDRLRSGDRPGWCDQSASPLGRKRHCARVRARVAAGQHGAAVVGRRHLLSKEALAEELEQKPSKTPKRSKAQELADELGLRLVGSAR